MKQELSSIIILFSFFFSFNACQKNEQIDEGDNPRTIISLDTRQDACNKSSEAFAFSMLERIDASSGSRGYFFSPLSVEFVLGMLANGCSGEARTQICDAIGTDDIDGLNSFAATMLERLPSMDKKTKLAIANLALFDNKVTPKDPYRQIIEKEYLAQVENKDFSSPNTASFVNGWASQRTEGLIKDITNYETLRQSLIFFANAAYFKSLWAGFIFDRVKSQPFTTATGKTIKVDMLETTKPDLGWAGFDKHSELYVPFGNNSFLFNIYLPDKGVEIKDMLDDIKEHKPCVTSGKTSIVRFPKFKKDYEVQLTSVLKSMGITSIFGDGDFSEMTTFTPIEVSNIVQKSYIDVNENGAEATAVTTVLFVTGASPHNEFIVDRPFLYSITESSTGATLFMGKYSGE